MFSRLLCPVNFDEFTSEQIAYARSFADFQRASLTVLHVIEPRLEMYGSMPLRELEQKLQKIAEEKMATFCGKDVDTRILIGSAAAEIVHAAEEGQFDLIILPTYGYTGLKRIILGSTFQEVINTSNTSVLALPPLLLRGAKLSFKKPERILCAVDMKRRSAKLCHLSKRLAEGSNGVFLVFHSIDFQEELFQFYSSHALEDLEKRIHLNLLSENPCAIRAQEVLIRRGSPSEQIVQCAEEKSIDFLVLGFSHPSARHLRKTLFRTVSTASIPVLCVPVD